MTVINLTYCGMNGSGPTVAAAKQDAARKIEAVLAGGYDPVVAKLNGITGIAFRTPGAWMYTIIWADTPDGVKRNLCTAQCGDRKDTVTRMLRHMADNCSDVAAVTAFLGDDKVALSDWHGKQRFYTAYRDAKHKGMNDGDAHRYACEHADATREVAA